MAWTAERIEMLELMWNQGKTSTQIAKQLGGVTRSAVIGKAHRMGLTPKAKQAAARTHVDTKSSKGDEESATDVPVLQINGESAEDTLKRLAAKDSFHGWSEAAKHCLVSLFRSGVTDDADLAQKLNETFPGRRNPFTHSAVAAQRGKHGLAKGRVGIRTPVRDPCKVKPPSTLTSAEEEDRAQLIELEKEARRISLLELTERTCKWPIGDPSDKDFGFCGQPSMPDSPYCEGHAAVARREPTLGKKGPGVHPTVSVFSWR